MDTKIRIGVIGVGHLGQYHVQKYRAIEGTDLVGIVDMDKDRALDIAKRYDTRSFKSVGEILDRVDAVSIAVPTESHFEVAREVLSHGVHLLIEKPITYEESQADELIELAARNSLALQVGHVERFNPAVVKMESLLMRPIFIESHRLNLFTVRGTDVDVVLDLMIHDLDIILHLVQSEIRELHAVGMSVLTGKTDIANVRIIFQNGTVANLTASRVSNNTLRKIRIFQPDAYISVNCFKKDISVTRLDDSSNSNTFPQIVSSKMSYPDADPLFDEISAFVRAVREKTIPVVTGEDGRRALKVAMAIMGQIEKGCKDFESIC
ncbi:MAG: Gfo/Idh/MocA family oxidoreductase [Desulfatiglandaceae bacterium]|jgi:predicted dehydrogenase